MSFVENDLKPETRGCEHKIPLTGGTSSREQRAMKMMMMMMMVLRVDLQDPRPKLSNVSTTGKTEARNYSRRPTVVA